MRGPLALLVASLACGQQTAIHHEDGALDPQFADTSPSSPAATIPHPVADDSGAFRAASVALAAGRPWYATQLLEPALRDSGQRSPRLILLAARAAAAWRGWSEVERLLAPEAWLDSLEAGAGRALLAEAAFEQKRPDASRHAARAVEAGATGRDRAGRLVLLARSLERGGQPDSARATYLRAATELPDVADWLRLRTAALTPDSAGRAALYASLGAGPARSQVRRVDAAALERSGDHAAAAAAYASVGASVDALRLRLLSATDPALRADVRRQLLSLVEGGSGQARQAIDLLDRSFAPLTDREELIVARTAARVGPPARAASGFSRASSARLLTAQDRFTYGTTLSRLGRERDAAAQFGLISEAPLAGRAAYQRARSLLRAGEGATARAMLDTVARVHAGDTAAASLALYLRGDLATDDGDDILARRLFASLAQRYPTSTYAPQARFRAALIAFVAGDTRGAASEFDSIASLFPASGEALASAYWSGRAWMNAGDSAAAVARWRQAIRREPLSYYAILAGRRLGTAFAAPPEAPDTFATFSDLDAGFSRARLLEQVGLGPEAGHEHQHLVDAAAGSTERMLATADAFRRHGLAPRATALARQALARNALPDARTYRLLYPLTMREVILAEAAANTVDHALVAALIRQESGFHPRATSPVGARGLMQIMPDVGRQLAQNLGFSAWDAELLYQPDVSLHLGTSHLADLLRGYPDIPRALAAYNAGGSRVERWSTRRGAADPEVFVERIPFVETRDYVRIVQRNRELYRALYPAPVAGPGARVGAN